MASWSREDEARFGELLRELAERHAETARFRIAAAPADEAFAAGMSVGDEVRRAVRRRALDRPDARDCTRLAAAVEALRALERRVGEHPLVEALNAAYRAADAAACARIACELFVGLSPAAVAGAAAYLPIALRRRGERGEIVLHPETAAEAIAQRLAQGLRSTAPEPDASGTRRVPEPIALLARFSDCESEVAIEVDLRAIPAPLLEHEPSGEVWTFADQIEPPPRVLILSDVDDEWWAASPVPYPAYVEALRAALAARSIAASVATTQAGER